MKLSIRIPTLNNYTGLLRAIKSIRAQHFSDYDLAIVDNNSDDGSWEKTSRLSDSFPGIVVYQNPKRGLAENWNYCVSTQTGDYLLIFHSDDEMLPGYLEKVVGFLDQHPNVGMVHTDCFDVREDGKYAVRYTQSRPILFHGSEALNKIAENCNIACSSVVVKSSIYRDHGVFECGNPSPDAEMWARIGRFYDIGHIATPLIKVYAHIDSHGRAALSSLPPASIESQWAKQGDKIVSYFDESEREKARRSQRRSLFSALCAAGELAWYQGRWERGLKFFMLSKKNVASRIWLKKIIRSLLSSMKFHFMRGSKK